MKRGLAYRCHYCSKNFSSSSSRANHHKRAHYILHKDYKGLRSSPKFPCRHCLAWYGTKSSLRTHRVKCPRKPTPRQTKAAPPPHLPTILARLGMGVTLYETLSKFPMEYRKFVAAAILSGADSLVRFFIPCR